MQAALFLAPSLPLKPTITRLPGRSPSRKPVAFPQIRAMAVPDTSTVDYSSPASVFPAEACDTVGGETCDAEMYPEVRPKMEADKSKTIVHSEEVDREYIEYNDPKTVFPGEACDDLGGEFCEPGYQEGVYQEKALSK